MTEELDRKMAQLRQKAADFQARHNAKVQEEARELAEMKRLRLERSRLWTESTIPAIKEAADWIRGNLSDVGYSITEREIPGENVQLLIQAHQEGNDRVPMVTFSLSSDGGVYAAIRVVIGGRETGNRREQLPDVGGVTAERVKELLVPILG